MTTLSLIIPQAICINIALSDGKFIQYIDASGNLNFNGCNGYNFDNHVNVVANVNVTTGANTANLILDDSGYLELQTSSTNGIWLNSLLGTESNVQLYGGSLQICGDSILNIACDHSSGVGEFSGCPSYSFDNNVSVLGNNVLTNQNGGTSSRPISPSTGQLYFDSDIGKPVWYNGTQWIDATGVPA